MIIGVDAGALSISDDRLKVGVWRVSFELLKALSCIDTSKCYRLYSFTPIPQEVMKKLGGNMKNVVLAPSLGYMKFRLPLELIKNPVDVFLGLSQASPFMVRGKSIGFVHDLRFLHLKDIEGSQTLSAQTEYMMRHATHIISVSQYVKDDVMKTYPISEKSITVAHSGISSIFSHSGKKVKRKIPYFLFVGSLRKGKNIPMLIEAFTEFLHTTKQLYDLLLVGGDYWRDGDIEKTIKHLRVKERVHSLGFIPDSQLAQYYRGAVALVTMTEMEGFGLPLVEAFASGCPVIAPRVGALPEVVEKAGILIQPGNGKDMVRAMQIMTNHETRTHYRRLGLTQATKYSWITFAETIRKVMER